MRMCNTLLNQANNIALTFDMSQFFCGHIRAIYHLNSNGAQITYDFLASRRLKYLSNVLTYLNIFVRRSLDSV